MRLVIGLGFRNHIKDGVQSQSKTFENFTFQGITSPSFITLLIIVFF
jgi:hypothetical protein